MTEYVGYSMRRESCGNSSKRVSFYLHDKTGLTKLAITGIDSRGTGHFVYESQPGLTPPLKCTNRTGVIAWLADRGASHLVEKSGHFTNQRSRRSNSKQQQQPVKPKLDRVYVEYREEDGMDGIVSYENFYIVDSTGEEVLAVLGSTVDDYCIYRCVIEGQKLTFEDKSEVVGWLDWIVGKSVTPPSRLIQNGTKRTTRASTALASKRKMTNLTIEDMEDIFKDADLMRWVLRKPSSGELNTFNQWNQVLSERANLTNEAKQSTSENVLEILKSIHEHETCLELLNVTSIARPISRLTKHSDSQVADLASKISVKWSEHQMSKTFGLKFQSRVLRPFPNTETSSWIVATTNLREENEIRVLEYDEKSETLLSPLVYVHQNEVWDLVVPSNDPNVLLTTHNSGLKYDVTAWKTKENGEHLEMVSNLKGLDQSPQRILWREDGDQGALLTLEDTTIKEWSLLESDPKETSCGKGRDLDQFSNMHLPKDDKNMLYVINHQGYQLWDLQNMKLVKSIEDCHDMPIKTLDTSDHFIATCGDDCLTKIWDNRKLDQAMSVLRGHSHWVWDCKFNPKFPSLLLTSSSDCSVLLWNTKQTDGDSPSDSNTPTRVMYEMSGDEQTTRFTDHDESVYCVDWSQVDEWTFASLSYDGRIAVNKVPSETKYRILI
eukprot:g8715.t1